MRKMTREDLIAICENAIVQECDWTNRDSADAQMQVGQCWVLLKAGCNFKVREDGDTIWLDITFHGFDYFEGHEPESTAFYLPTMNRLEGGEDWY